MNNQTESNLREENNIVSFERLEPYLKTPRSIEGAGAEIVGKPPLFFKKKWKREVENFPIIYVGVVEANTQLFTPGDGEFIAGVFVFAEDEAHSRNQEWLHKTIELINTVRESDNIPEDAKKIIAQLNNEESGFCEPLPYSLAGNAKAWITTYKIDKQTELPKHYLPDNRILPFLLLEAKSAWGYGLKLIPAKCYAD